MFNRLWLAAGAMGAGVLGLLGCDQQRIDALHEGLSTEADVRAQFGEPVTIWPEADGSRTLEYNRQPDGAPKRHDHHWHRWHDERPAPSAHAQRFCPGAGGHGPRAGAPPAGQPAKRMSFALKQETDRDWRWIDPPAREMVFTVTFGPDGRVLRSGSSEKLPEGR